MRVQIQLTVPYPDGSAAYISVPYPMDEAQYSLLLAFLGLWKRGLVEQKPVEQKPKQPWES